MKCINYIKRAEQISQESRKGKIFHNSLSSKNDQHNQQANSRQYQTPRKTPIFTQYHFQTPNIRSQLHPRTQSQSLQHQVPLRYVSINRRQKNERSIPKQHQSVERSSLIEQKQLQGYLSKSQERSRNKEKMILAAKQQNENLRLQNQRLKQKKQQILKSHAINGQYSKIKQLNAEYRLKLLKAQALLHTLKNQIGESEELKEILSIVML